MSQVIDARLRELLIFSTPPTAFGLPRSLFVQLLVLGGGLGVMLTWWFGVVVFVLVFAPLYRAHQSDPQAMAVWTAALRGLVVVVGVSPFIPSYLAVEID